MKKLLACALSGMLLISLAACGGEGETPAETEAVTPSPVVTAEPAESAAPVAEETSAPQAEAPTPAPAESASAASPEAQLAELTAVLTDTARASEHADALKQLNTLWYEGEGYEPAYQVLLDYLRAGPRSEVLPDPQAMAVFTENPFLITGPAWMNLEDIINLMTSIALDPNAGLAARTEAVRAVAAQASEPQLDAFGTMVHGLTDGHAKELQAELDAAREEFATGLR